MIGSGEAYTPFRAGDDPQVSYQYGSALSQTVAKTILDAGIHNCGRAVLKVCDWSYQHNYAEDNECRDFVKRCRLYHNSLSLRS